MNFSVVKFYFIDVMSVGTDGSRKEKRKSKDCAFFNRNYRALCLGMKCGWVLC